jgi:TonB family protein
MLEMMDISLLPVGVNESPERRLHPRRPVSALAYADLGEDNGGLVLNLSEGGMAVRAAVILAGDDLPKIRFQLPGSRGWFEAAGQIAWTGDSRKIAGIQFRDLRPELRQMIQAWITSPEFGSDLPRKDQPPAPGNSASSTLSVSAAPSMDSPPSTPAADPPLPLALQDARFQPPGGLPAARHAKVESVAKPPLIQRTTRLSNRTPDSILGLHATGVPGEGVPQIFSRGRLQFSVIALLLAAGSFAIGLGAGRLGFGGIWAAAKRLIGGASSSVSLTRPQSAVNTASAADLAAPNSNLSASSPASSPHSGISLRVSKPAASQSGGSVAPIGSSAGRPALNAAVQRKASSASAPAKSANEDQGSSSVLNFPETPISASSSVAIGSRLYVSVPASTDSQLAGNLQIGRLIRRVDVTYPPEAVQQNLQGIVKLHITIAQDGSVREVSAISGEPVLASAAEDAIRQWRYRPTLLDGQPIETEADITVEFRPPLNSQ